MGRETVQALRAAGKDVVALVRTEEAAKDLEGLGVNAIIGDAFVYKVTLFSSRSIHPALPVVLYTRSIHVFNSYTSSH